MAGEVVEDAKENKENEVTNEDQSKEKEVQNEQPEERKFESRRKSSSRSSKLAPGDHTMVKRMDGTWCMVFNHFRPTVADHFLNDSSIGVFHFNSAYFCAPFSESLHHCTNVHAIDSRNQLHEHLQYNEDFQ